MIYAENILICIAVPLAISLLFTKGNARRLLVCILTGMIVCIFSAYISGFLEVASGFSSEDTSIFLSPIVEEVMKLLGAGFATFENCCFIISAGTPQLTFVLIRGFAVGVMHIVTLVALAKGIQLLKTYKVCSLAGIAGVLSMSVTVHGLYNLLVSQSGISSFIGFSMPMICAILLYLVNRRTEGYD